MNSLSLRPATTTALKHIVAQLRGHLSSAGVFSHFVQCTPLSTSSTTASAQGQSSTTKETAEAGSASTPTPTANVAAPSSEDNPMAWEIVTPLKPAKEPDIIKPLSPAPPVSEDAPTDAEMEDDRVIFPEDIESRREWVEMRNENAPAGPEWGGPLGYEPTRYGDWASKGRVSDF